MGFFFFVVVIAFIIYLSSSSVKANRTKWQEAAQALGLSFSAGGFGSIGKISGLVNGNHVSVTTFSRGSGSSSQTYTKYTMEYRQPVGIDFKMTLQRMKHSVGKAFGLQDIEVGNPAFDDQILLQGGNPAQVVRLLSSELQEETCYLASTYPDIVITNGLVAVSKRGTDTETSSIIQTIRTMATYCDVISEHAVARASGPYDAMDENEQQAEEEIIEIEPVEPPLNPLATSNPVVPDPPWLPVGIEHEPEANGLAFGEDPDSGPAAEERTEESDVLEVLGLGAVAEELSGGSSANAIMAPARFAQEFKGRRIAADGVLKRVSKFSYDPVFTDAKGVKATFSICEVAGPYSKTRVTAVVKYPEGEYDALSERIDASFPIAGTLIAFDSMLHQYFIEP